jgi:hypothetical protein
VKSVERGRHVISDLAKPETPRGSDDIVGLSLKIYVKEQ